MSEPLLQLADAVGGDWPARIREALAHIFQAEAAFDLQHSKQLLADIRDCFAHHFWPKRLSTAALLGWMHSLPSRPWDADGPITARTFARLLLPFDVRPRVQRIGSSDPARGYQLEDFVESWQTHLNFTVPDVLAPAATSPTAPDAADLSRRAVEGPPWRVTDERDSEIANKDAGCNPVTDSRAVSVPSQEKQKSDEELPECYPIPPHKVQPNGHDIPVQQSSI